MKCSNCSKEYDENKEFSAKVTIDMVEKCDGKPERSRWSMNLCPECFQNEELKLEEWLPCTEFVETLESVVTQ